MDKEFFDRVEFGRRIAKGDDIVTINVELLGIEPDKRIQIETAANNFINLAKEILKDS